MNLVVRCGFAPLAVFLLTAAVCGDPGDGSPPDRCYSCTPQQRCIDAESRGFRCANLCRSSDDCDQGHACIPCDAERGCSSDDTGDIHDLDATMPADAATLDASPSGNESAPMDASVALDASTASGTTQVDATTASVCDPRCSPLLCKEHNPRFECDGVYGDCHEVACGVNVPCLDTSKICDTTVPRCVSAVGECAIDSDCPLFDRRLSQIATQRCDVSRRLCQLEEIRSASPLVTSNPGLARIGINHPKPGTVFASSESVRFAWTGHEGSTLVLVMNALPEGSADIKGATVWAGAQPGGVHSITWPDLVAVRNGVWGGKPPVLADQPLYLQVIGVRGGKRLSASDIIPFMVGPNAAWKEPGASCEDEGELPGSCAHPSLAMTCRFGRCMVLCLSNDDCACETCAPDLQCTAPAGAARICD